MHASALTEREAKKLSTGERNFLEGLRGSHLRLYEILEVRIDQGFELRDLWDDRRLYVRERAATRQIVVWDLVVARIGPGGDGETVFETLPYLFPVADKDDLLKGFRKAHQIFTQEFPDKSISDFFRKIAQKWGLVNDYRVRYFYRSPVKVSPAH